MIMPKGQQLLLPANPVFVWATVLAALLLNTIPWGRQAWIPDWLALVLVFWSVHQPLRVGLGAAFVFGLLMDVTVAGPLGLQALGYVGLVYLSTALHRRIVWFSLPVQALQVLPLFVVSTAIEVVARVANGGVMPPWTVVLAPVLQALLWAPMSHLLLAPQRRAPSRESKPKPSRL
jgi:rod shape-determining protein MreD